MKMFHQRIQHILLSLPLFVLDAPFTFQGTQGKHLGYNPGY